MGKSVDLLEKLTKIFQPLPEIAYLVGLIKTEETSPNPVVHPGRTLTIALASHLDTRRYPLKPTFAHEAGEFSARRTADENAEDEQEVHGGSLHGRRATKDLTR